MGGSKGDGKGQRHTWFGHYNTQPWRWIRGPNLLERRYFHSCSLLQMNEKSFVIVVGGSVSLKHGSMKSVLWMDTKSTGWSRGIT